MLTSPVMFAAFRNTLLRNPCVDVFRGAGYRAITACGPARAGQAP